MESGIISEAKCALLDTNSLRTVAKACGENYKFYYGN